MMIDSKSENKDTLSEDINELGNTIKKKLHPDDSSHSDSDFCQKLARACVNYNRKTQNFLDDTQALRSSMRYDIYIDE